jgi:hypothetical protein
MATRLVLLPYLENWDGANLQANLLIIPRGSPVDPLTVGSPSFAQARFDLEVHIISGPDALPTIGGPATTVINKPVPVDAQAVFDALAAQFVIDPAPPPATPRPAGTQIKKHLPLSYQVAAQYVEGRTPFVYTDDSYSCARTAPPPQPYKKILPPDLKMPWGKIIASLLRQPLLADGAGLVRDLSIAIDPNSLLSSGGWLYVTLAPSSDAAGLLGVPDGLKIYASRIPPLMKPRSLFSPVLFPVVAIPPPGSYDQMFAETDNYIDGFAKTVHCAQPQYFDPLNEKADDTRPVKELGIRLGWDDEQVTTWLNRQISPAAAAQDAPMGVSGYRIDARQAGATAWHSLCHASGPVKVGSVPLGTFDGDLAVQTQAVQLEAQRTGDYWLPSYYINWSGPSLVTLDTDTILLAGGPDKRDPTRVQGVQPDIELRYGRTYEFRVRLGDATGGGPRLSDGPSIPGPASTASVPFRRYVRPSRVKLLDDIAVPPDPANPPTSIKVQRPLLGHPAVALTGGYTDPIGLLKADLPAAKAEGREPALADPDVDSVQITVEVRGFVQDPAASDAGYQPLYVTTRPFPADLKAPLQLGLSWVDVADVNTIAPLASGTIELPTGRDIRLLIASLCRQDPHLEYFGAEDVRLSPPTTVSARKHSSDEGNLFAPDLPTHRFSALFLQPDSPIDATLLAAQRTAGEGDQRLSDVQTSLASHLGLRNDGLRLRGRPGRRTVFGCSAALRHTVGPDGASIDFATQSDLTKHWLCVIRLLVNRDWTWDAIVHNGITVQRDGVVVGQFSPSNAISLEALQNPERGQTDLVFFDAIDPKPSVGAFPAPLHPSYSVSVQFNGAPAEDPPLTLEIDLPVTTPPAQRPQLMSAGLAMSTYKRADDYSSTEPRQRVLWLEFDRVSDDPNDRYFARVLRNAPDPLLSSVSQDLSTIPDPPLPVDPEWIRVIVQGQSDDRAGLDAMQELVPSDSPLHYMLPLPPGTDPDSPELFGFYTYEFRVGHATEWSTAQGRFGPQLRVAGVHHPPPSLTVAVIRNTLGITASAPFALPVFDGRSVQPSMPHSEIWVLLYAQAEQVDGTDRRNVLLGHRPALWQRHTHTNTPRGSAFGTATFSDANIRFALDSLTFRSDTPLSVLAVELLANGEQQRDPLGSQLGTQRILRTSPLVPVPKVC